MEPASSRGPGQWEELAKTSLREVADLIGAYLADWDYYKGFLPEMCGALSGCAEIVDDTDTALFWRGGALHG